MRVLIACEMSGEVREAFRRAGHSAMSCDLLPSRLPGPHYQGDVRPLLTGGWDLLIAFPPCTYLTRAGAHLWRVRQAEQETAALFVRQLANAPIAKIAVENPIGRLNQLWRYPDQTIQPWEHGHPYTKATCLWLKNLPHLIPTKVCAVAALPNGRCWTESFPGSKDRSIKRSITPRGIADAMAAQWGRD